MFKKLNLTLILCFANQILSMEQPKDVGGYAQINSESTFGLLPAEIFVKIINELKNQKSAKEILSSIVKFAGICPENRQFIKEYLPELLRQLLDVEKKFDIKQFLATGKLPEIILDGFRKYAANQNFQEIRKRTLLLKEEIASKKDQFTKFDKNRIINLLNIGMHVALLLPDPSKNPGNTSLNYLARKRLFTLPLDVELQQKNEMLCHAIAFNHLDLAKLLIKLGADVNCFVNEHIGNNLNEFVPLGIAVTNSNFPMVKLLLKNGADLNYQDHFQEGIFPSHLTIYSDTILMKAIRIQSIPIIKLLLDEGASLNVKNYEDDTVLSLAVKLNNKKILQMLLDNGANIVLKSDALIQAVLNNNIELMDCLLANGANINFVNEKDFTPLMYAVLHNCNKEVVFFLLSHGADIDLKNRNGKTAAAMAYERGYIEIGWLILNYQWTQVKNQADEIGQVVQELSKNNQA